MSDSGSESEELNSTTSSRDLSASTYLSSDSMSESEDTDADEQEQVNEQRTDETCSNEEEDPLYKGSKISNVFSFVLIVPFVLKHNLSNSAWADLLRLLTALLGERCKKSLQSVHKVKSFMKQYFGSTEPTKTGYCASCSNQVKDRCPKAGCRGAAVTSFLDVHFEEKVSSKIRNF